MNVSGFVTSPAVVVSVILALKVVVSLMVGASEARLAPLCQRPETAGARPTARLSV